MGNKTLIRPNNILVYCHQTNTIYPSLHECARRLHVRWEGIKKYRKECWTQYKGYTFVFSGNEVFDKIKLTAVIL